MKSGWEEHNALQYNIIQEVLYSRHTTWEEAYREYDGRVKDFFKDKSSEKLLVLDIPGGDGWSKLCSFLNAAVPKKPFPHENSASSAKHPILSKLQKDSFTSD
jgi:hypothetical protein